MRYPALIMLRLAVLGTLVVGKLSYGVENHREQLQKWLSTQGYGPALQVQQVNVFGDGNSENGIEDSRIDMSSPRWNESGRQPWNMGAGTVHCDGRNRGSAMIVDTQEIAALRQGLIVVSSAHVLFDLDKKQRYRRCQFHYMALDQLPGYQGDIDLGRSRVGQFDPAKARESLALGQDDWAFLYIADEIPGISHSGRIKLRSFESVQTSSGYSGEVQFIAFNPDSGSINISTECVVRESSHGDLGGGSWKGQLLDNCDSGGGASGGGLVANIDGQSYLVGIRNGAHWDGAAYPAVKFPQGPPSGAPWDISANTNFSRAIDRQLLAVLASMVLELNQGISAGSPTASSRSR